MKLICEFDGVVCGESGNLNDVVDVRCTPCEEKYGSYKNMERIFKQKASPDHSKFLKFMEKCEKKIKIFNKNLKKEYGNNNNN